MLWELTPFERNSIALDEFRRIQWRGNAVPHQLRRWISVMTWSRRRTPITEAGNEGLPPGLVSMPMSILVADDELGFITSDSRCV